MIIKKTIFTIIRLYVTAFAKTSIAIKTLTEALRFLIANLKSHFFFYRKKTSIAANDFEMLLLYRLNMKPDFSTGNRLP